MATYEELIAKSRELAAAGDIASARRVAQIALQFAPPKGGSSVDQQALTEFGQVADRVGDGLTSSIVGARNGASLGLADNLKGAVIGGIGGGVPTPDGNISMFNYDTPVAERYTGVRDQVRGELGDARANNPKAAIAGEIGGGVATVLASAPAAAGKTTLQTIAKILGIGATEGAIAGGGNADGKPILPEVGKGAALGTAVGAAAMPVAAAVRMGGRLAANPVRNISGVASPTVANRTVARAMQRSGTDIGQLQRDMASAGADGQEVFTVADALGDAGQRALNGVTRQPGPGRTLAADQLNNRQLGMNERLSAYLSDAMGTTDTAAATRSNLTAGRKEAADVEYPAARADADPVDIRGALGVIDARIGPMAGSNVTGDGIDGILSRYRSRLAADTPPDGTLGVELSDFDRVLGVKQDLADEIESAVRAGQNNKVRELTKLRDSLDAALEQSSTLYRQANDNFRDASRVIDSVDTGVKAYRPGVRADDTIPQFQSMTPDQQQAHRAGYADRASARIEAAAPTNNTARDFRTPKRTAEMEAFALDPDQWARRVGRENTMFETRNTTLGNSSTINNAGDVMDTNGVDVGMISNFLTGNWGAAGTQGMQKLGNMASGGNEATRELIARALLSNDPQAALAPVLRQVGRDQGTQAIIEAMLRRSATGQLNQGINP